MATDLTMMNIYRFFQGIGEGIMVPIGMTIVCAVFPEEERGTALGVFGVGASCGPAIGPSLGGVITEHLSWPWVFYINLPIGLLGILLTLFVLWETGPRDKKRIPFDLPGFLTMSIAVGSLIIFLSKGQEKGWLQSDFILGMIAVFIVSFPLFIWIEFNTKDPLIDLRVFKNKTFSLTIVCMAFLSISIYAIMVLMPLYLERGRGFTTLEAGLILLPGSCLSIIGILLAGWLTDRYNPKKLFLISAALMVVGGILMSAFDQHTERSIIIFVFILWVPPMLFCFPPIQAMGLAQIGNKINLASSLQNVSRLLAGCIGTALAVTLQVRRSESLFESFGRYITHGNTATEHIINSQQAYVSTHGTPASLIDTKALRLLLLIIEQKAFVYSVGYTILWVTIIAGLSVIFCLLIKNKDVVTGGSNKPMH
jgi:DHA2 family multidrug resistance protein